MHWDGDGSKWMLVSIYCQYIQHRTQQVVYSLGRTFELKSYMYMYCSYRWRLTARGDVY